MATVIEGAATDGPVAWDPWNRAMFLDPHPVFRRLRDEALTFRSGRHRMQRRERTAYAFRYRMHHLPVERLILEPGEGDVHAS